jgi:hypothetical protein
MLSQIMSGLDTCSTLDETILSRVNDLTPDEREELDEDILDILDEICDNTNTITPLYQIMASLPGVYFSDEDDQATLIVKIGKTIEVLHKLSAVL